MRRLVLIAVGVALAACSSSKGPAGPVGPTGPSGAQGSQGLQGPQGVPGQAGEAGPQGVAGPQGIQGVAGSQGPIGAKGLTWRGAWSPLVTYSADDAVEFGGSAWIALGASTGAQPPGPDWQLLAAKGDTGATGAQGAKGEVGATGQQGPVGADGPRGATGPAGPQGLPGLQGAAGPAGAVGPQGPQGAAGPQGIQGANGPAGVPGPKGLNWMGPWSAFLSYSPDDVVESNGSSFVALLTTSIGSQPPNAQWAVVAAVGAPGAPGVAGAKGDTGSPGPAGVAGPQGASGTSVTTSPLLQGDPTCAYGGVLVQSASGADYVCHGAPGATGAPGSSGISVSAVSLAPGDDAACPAGGTKFLTGATVTYACSAAPAATCPSGQALCGSVCRDLASDASNCGVCGNTCSTGACNGGGCSKLVFVTSETWNGNLGGVAGADAKCQAAAANAGLPGTFRAWISSKSTPPPALSFQKSLYGYHLLTGGLIARDWTSFVSGAGLLQAIHVTELATESSSPVWSGTNQFGLSVSVDPAKDGYCMDWTDASTYSLCCIYPPPVIATYVGGTGSATSATSTWSGPGGLGCNQFAALYCFEQ